MDYTRSGLVSVIDALRCLKNVLGATNEFRGVDYDRINICQTKYLPQEYEGTVIFEFPPASAVKDVASQMECMDRKKNGHPWCQTFTTNIKNDHNLVFKKTLCAGKFDCRYFIREHVRNEQDWSGTCLNVCKVGVKVPIPDTVVCSHCKVPPFCLGVCSGRMY